MFSKTAIYTLRHRNFRLFWLGHFISRIGSEMQVVAIIWHIYLLTNSPFALGLIGLSRFLPLIFFSLIGGISSDIISRKKIIFLAQIIMTLSTFILVITTHNQTTTPLTIYLVLGLLSLASAFDTPARQSLIPHLVPKGEFVKAVSLNSIMWHTAVLVGPSLAGFTIAFWGVETVYLINALTFFAVICALLLMDPLKKVSPIIVQFKLDSLKEGLSFVFRTPIISSTMFIDFFATFFSSATVLLPIFAKDILKVGPQGLGFLYAAPAIGSILASLFISHTQNLRNQGKILIFSVIVYGLATIFFGLSRSYLASLLFMGLAGVGDGISSIIRSTVRQVVTPDHLRGRMVSINQIFFFGGPQLGEVEAGIVAGLIGSPLAVITGGIATILVTAFIAYLTPTLRKYQGHETVPIV